MKCIKKRSCSKESIYKKINKQNYDYVCFQKEYSCIDSQILYLIRVLLEAPKSKIPP